MSVKRQMEFVGVNRSSVYRNMSPKPVAAEELHQRNIIDRIHTDNPTWGYRMITRKLRRDHGQKINRKKVLRIMRNTMMSARIRRWATIKCPGEVYSYKRAKRAA